MKPVIGEARYFAGETFPPGWIGCDGSEVSRDVYRQLFDVIGTEYGSGDGETTFNLPAFPRPQTVGGEATAIIYTGEDEDL